MLCVVKGFLACEEGEASSGSSAVINGTLHSNMTPLPPVRAARRRRRCARLCGRMGRRYREGRSVFAQCSRRVYNRGAATDARSVHVLDASPGGRYRYSREMWTYTRATVIRRLPDIFNCEEFTTFRSSTPHKQSHNYFQTL